MWVLVTDVTDVTDGIATVAAVHSAPELATSADTVIDDVTPWPTVIETDLRGVVWTHQLGGCAATLTEAQIGRTRAAVEGRGSGTALAGPNDGRWAHKKQRGELIRAVCSDATSTLLADT